MSAHSSIVGGSSAGRVIACPGSRKLAAQAPPRKPSTYAEQGTRLHEIIASEAEHDVSADELALLASAAEAVNWHGDVKPDFLAQEVAVELKPIPGAFGTVDLVRAYGTVLEVIDWKFGQGVQVWPENNAQLLFYGAALMYSLPHFSELSEIKLVIVQPNDRDLPVWREWSVDTLELFEFTRRLQRAVALGDAAEPPYAAGEHCRWCPANIICPVLKAKAEQAISLDPKHMTPAQLAEALILADELDGWPRRLYEYAHEQMTAGVAVPGRKLVEKRAPRTWINPEATIDVLKGLGHNDIYDIKLKSPTQIEKMKINVDDLVEARSSGTVVVADTDKRPAFVPGGAFKAFSEQVNALNKRQKSSSTQQDTKS